MAGFRIRRAGEKDAPRISYLIKSSIGMGDFLLIRKESEIRDAVRKGGFFVAVGDGGIAGCAGLEEYGGIAELRSLVIDRNWRGKGIGKALIDRVAGLARERKYDKLYAFADESLTGIYGGQGFRDMGRFIGEGGRALDMGGKISEKMKRYCLKCERYGVCTEHLMCRELKAGKRKFSP